MYFLFSFFYSPTSCARCSHAPDCMFAAHTLTTPSAADVASVFPTMFQSTL
jgi:hypothetical protein